MKIDWLRGLGSIGVYTRCLLGKSSSNLSNIRMGHRRASYCSRSRCRGYICASSLTLVTSIKSFEYCLVDCYHFRGSSGRFTVVIGPYGPSCAPGQYCSSSSQQRSVAHRLDTISGLDLIAVMQDGACVEFGNPAVLLQRPSIFRELYDAYRATNVGEKQ